MSAAKLRRIYPRLYTYMVFRLIDANIKNDTKILDEVAHLLTELKTAWDTIRPQVIQPMPPQATAANNAQRVYGSA